MPESKSYFRKVSYKSVLFPCYSAGSVLDIPIKTLVGRGIRHIILDIDGTLVVRRSNQLSPAYIAHFAAVREAGIALSIGTNSRRDISGIASAIGASVVPRRWWTYKPMQHFYTAIIASTGHTPAEIVMVGDRILNDVIAANRAGLVTILVPPLGRPTSWLLGQYQQYLRR